MSIELIEHNPLLKKPAMTVLSICSARTNIGREELERQAISQWADTFRQSPSTVIGVLSRHALIEEQVFVNGETYPGGLENVQLDASVPDDAVVESQVSLTTEGERMLEEYAPSATLRALFSDRPRYEAVYRNGLTACASEGGCTRASLEAALEEALLEAFGLASEQKKVYPQYFIDALETAGGIEWNGTWRTTNAGNEVLER